MKRDLQNADTIVATYSDGKSFIIKNRFGEDGIEVDDPIALYRSTFGAFDLEVARTMRRDEHSTEADLAHYALGLAGECGEVCEPIKKHCFNGRSLDRNAVLGEIGDVLWYASALAQSLGSSLAEAAEMNAEKLRKRYPHGYVNGGGNRED